MEERFEKIATDAIQLAEKIECPLAEYRDGLKAMIDVLKERYDQVNDEVGD